MMVGILNCRHLSTLGIDVFGVQNTDWGFKRDVHSKVGRFVLSTVYYMTGGYLDMHSNELCTLSVCLCPNGYDRKAVGQCLHSPLAENNPSPTPRPFVSHRGCLFILLDWFVSYYT